jgi:hypothetical protein
MQISSGFRGRNKIYAIAQAVVSGLGLITGIPAALILLVISYIEIANGFQNPGQSSLTLVYAFTITFLALALVPGLVTAIYRIQNKTEPKFPSFWLFL